MRSESTPFEQSLKRLYVNVCLCTAVEAHVPNRRDVQSPDRLGHGAARADTDDKAESQRVQQARNDVSVQLLAIREGQFGRPANRRKVPFQCPFVEKS